MLHFAYESVGNRSETPDETFLSISLFIKTYASAARVMVIQFLMATLIRSNRKLRGDIYHHNTVPIPLLIGVLNNKNRYVIHISEYHRTYLSLAEYLESLVVFHLYRSGWRVKVWKLFNVVGEGELDLIFSVLVQIWFILVYVFTLSNGLLQLYRITGNQTTKVG